MRMIILAAGRGERLMPLTRNTPKPLLDMGNGNTLLEEQIQGISASGVIDEVVIVVGYLAEQVEAKIQKYAGQRCRVRTIFNPLWHVSNNLISLWMARHELLTSDVMITNGDNLFSSDVFSQIVLKEDGIWLTASLKNEFDEDDMKITLQDGLIARVHKSIPGALASAESPGLAMVRGSRSRAIFLEQLDYIVRNPSNINGFWLETFNSLWERGVPVKPWFCDMRGKWQEVDFHLDLEVVRSMIAAKMRSFREG